MEVKSLQELIVYNQDRFTKKVAYHKENCLAFVLNFAPGQSLPPHKHPGSDVLITVLNGQGTVNVDGQEREVKPLDVLHCADQESLSFKNTGTENTSLYVVMNKIPDERYAKEIG